MRFVYFLLAAVVAVGMVGCRPKSDQDIRVLKFKLAKRQEKKEEENKLRIASK